MGLKGAFTIGARALYNILRSECFSFARAHAYIARCLAVVACVLAVAPSLLKILDMHKIQTRPNAIKIIAMQRTNISTNVLQHFVYSQEWCTIYQGRMMNRSCLCFCFATMRLLLNVSHVILQRFTIIARFISFNLPCFATTIYTLYKHISVCSLGLGCCLVHFLGRHLRIQLCQLKSVGNVRYIYPGTRTSIRTIKSMIARAPHVKLHCRTFNRPITWSLARSYRIILQHSLSLYNSHI